VFNGVKYYYRKNKRTKNATCRVLKSKQLLCFPQR